MYAVVKVKECSQKRKQTCYETKDKKIEAKKRNEVAMANLAMAFTNEARMGLIYKSMTTEWPSGLAYIFIEVLIVGISMALPVPTFMYQ